MDAKTVSAGFNEFPGLRNILSNLDLHSLNPANIIGELYDSSCFFHRVAQRGHLHLRSLITVAVRSSMTQLRFLTSSDLQGQVSSRWPQ